MWEDCIFLIFVEDDNLVFLCISIEGNSFWKRILGSGNKVVFSGEGNFVFFLLSIDGKYVWVFVGMGILVCYDFEGNEVWKINLEDRYGYFDFGFVMVSILFRDGDWLYL